MTGHGCLIPGHVKQNTLKFDILLLCLVLSVSGLKIGWPAGSQDNGLRWAITTNPWRDVTVGSHSTKWVNSLNAATPTYVTLFIDQATELDAPCRCEIDTNNSLTVCH